MTAIPRTIHHIWIGSKFPKELARRRDTWAEHNPGWEMKLWTEENISTEFGPLLQRCGSHVQRADILRYEILHREGGVYVDVDFEALKGLDALLKNKTTFTVLEHRTSRRSQVSVGLIGSAPGHPMYAEILSLLESALDPYSPNSLGPPLFMRAAQYRENVTVFPKRVFYPTWKEMDDAFAFHHPRSGNWHKDSAAFVIQTAPEEMRAGKLYRVSVVMKNTSPVWWSEEEKVRLGAQSPHDNYTWRFPRVLFPFGQPIAPGVSLKINFEVIAPTTPGVYNFQWRMVREGVHWFGSASQPLSVRVE